MLGHFWENHWANTLFPENWTGTGQRVETVSCLTQGAQQMSAEWANEREKTVALVRETLWQTHLSSIFSVSALTGIPTCTFLNPAQIIL